MPRAPFNAFTYPYRQSGDGAPEYALLLRSDAGIWHGASGGGEDDETPLDAARREAFEEAGILVGRRADGSEPATAAESPEVNSVALMAMPL